MGKSEGKPIDPVEMSAPPHVDVALVAILLRLEDQAIEAEKNEATRNSLNGVRRNLRRERREKTGDQAPSDKPVDIELEEGFISAMEEVPSEFEALQVIVEASAAEPWETDLVLAPRRRRPLPRPIKSVVLAEACAHLPCRDGVSESVLSALYSAGRVEAFRSLPLRKRVIVGGSILAFTAVSAYTGAVAAPIVGGAIGGAAGLYGAAATSAGLAALGGGAVAAGGLGMAGGTFLVATAAGATGAGLSSLVAMQAGDFRRYGKMLEILVAESWASEDPITRGKATEIVAALESQIAGLRAERELFASSGSENGSRLNEEIDRRSNLLKRLNKVVETDLHD